MVSCDPVGMNGSGLLRSTVLSRWLVLLPNVADRKSRIPGESPLNVEAPLGDIRLELSVVSTLAFVRDVGLARRRDS